MSCFIDAYYRIVKKISSNLPDLASILTFDWEISGIEFGNSGEEPPQSGALPAASMAVTLPDDIIEQIVMHLLDDISAVCRFSAVSKHWHEYLLRKNPLISIAASYQEPESSSVSSPNWFWANAAAREDWVWKSMRMPMPTSGDAYRIYEDLSETQISAGIYCKMHMSRSYAAQLYVGYLFEPPARILEYPQLHLPVSFALYTDLLTRSYLAVFNSLYLGYYHRLVIYNSNTQSWKQSPYPTKLWPTGASPKPVPAGTSIHDVSIYFLHLDHDTSPAIFRYMYAADSWSCKPCILLNLGYPNVYLGHCNGKLMISGRRESDNMPCVWHLYEEADFYVSTSLSSPQNSRLSPNPPYLVQYGHNLVLFNCHNYAIVYQPSSNSWRVHNIVRNRHQKLGELDPCLLEATLSPHLISI